MTMLAKGLVTLGVLVFLLVIPILELNPSHVFNPAWPAHARLHEVWQLATNCMLGLLCLWLSWVKEDIRMASVLSIMVMGGALFAHLTEGLYGGSILSGNTSATIFGLELAAFAAITVIVLALLAAALDWRSTARRGP